MERFIPVYESETRDNPGRRFGILDLRLWLVAAFGGNRDRRDTELSRIHEGMDASTLFWHTPTRGSTWSHNCARVDRGLHGISDPISKHEFMVGSE